MANLAHYLIFAALSGASLQSAARPNLSGTWKHAEGAVAAIEMRLDQSETEINVQKAGFPSVVLRFDGMETRSVHQPPIPADSTVMRRFKAKWSDGRLVVTVTEETKIRDVSMGLQYSQETMYLDNVDRLIVEVQRLVPMSGARPQGPPGTAAGGPPLMVSPEIKKSIYVRAKSN